MATVETDRQGLTLVRISAQRKHFRVLQASAFWLDVSTFLGLFGDFH